MSARRIFTSGRREAKFGHGRYLNAVATSRSTDNQEKVVGDMLRERARRALYADCDRAPLDWENAAA
uniref:hypothetical protein n=1 Tax=uncultured Erythrobacter sp. TaxID=263913 RepID=UPI0026203EB3|nr:hypothetical protein [uncultured Erythrobacter sp.]